MMTPNSLNKAGREQLLDEADQMREMLMSFAHNAIKLYLKIDRVKNSDHEAIEFFVLGELLERPDEEKRLALTVRLEPSNPDPDRLITPDKSLTIFYPISDDLDFTSPDFNPEDLPATDRVFFVYEKDGEKLHVVVGDGESGFYIPTDLEGPQSDEILASEDVIDGLETKIVQSGLPLLATMYEDLINMKGVMQRRIQPGGFITEV